MISDFKMNIISKLVSLLIVSNLLTACVPFPTKNTVVPNISGALLDGGEGVSNIEVKLAYGVNDACSSDKFISVYTDDNGKFKFGSTHKWSMIRWAVPLDQIDYFNLCFVSLEGGNKWAYVTHIRTPSWAPSINLSCTTNRLLSQPKAVEGPYELKSTCEKEQS